LPPVGELVAVLAEIKETADEAEDVIVGMYNRDERPGAMKHYYAILEGYGYEFDD